MPARPASVRGGTPCSTHACIVSHAPVSCVDRKLLDPSSQLKAQLCKRRHAMRGKQQEGVHAQAFSRPRPFVIAASAAQCSAVAAESCRSDTPGRPGASAVANQGPATDTKLAVSDSPLDSLAHYT
eukprot:6171855-Pleurochrysis_carterae.AAC.3